MICLTHEMGRARAEERAAHLGLKIDFRQSNHQGVLIDAIHEARKKAAGIIINPAGLSFHAVLLLNAAETGRPAPRAHPSTGQDRRCSAEFIHSALGRTRPGTFPFQPKD
jgi:3-dehydroquinate dehydratase